MGCRVNMFLRARRVVVVAAHRACGSFAVSLQAAMSAFFLLRARYSQKLAFFYDGGDSLRALP